MRKYLLFVVAFASSLYASANPEIVSSEQPLIDQETDSTEVTFISDIIKVQEEVTTRNDLYQHFEDVWKRRSYVNIGYNSSKLIPKDDVPTGMGPGTKLEDAKSNWSASLQVGRTYRLHKKPIFNTVQFGIDYTGIDLCVNHYALKNDGPLYDSKAVFTKTDSKTNSTKDYYYTPWDLEKIEASYGMTIGPSVTIAPFNYLDVRPLHYFKIHAYFRIGYQASIAYMMNHEEADLNTNETDQAHKDMKDNVKLDWGHGLLTSLGIGFTWKMIGFGFEHRVAKNKYTTLMPDTFVDDSYDFSTTTNLFYLTFRMGR